MSENEKNKDDDSNGSGHSVKVNVLRRLLSALRDNSPAMDELRSQLR